MYVTKEFPVRFHYTAETRTPLLLFIQVEYFGYKLGIPI